MHGHNHSWKWGFQEVLDNVEHGLNMKIQKILVPWSRDISKNLQKWPKYGIFPHLRPLVIFFKQCHYGILTSCTKRERKRAISTKMGYQKNKETNGQINRGDCLGSLCFNKPGVQSSHILAPTNLIILEGVWKQRTPHLFQLKQSEGNFWFWMEIMWYLWFFRISIWVSHIQTQQLFDFIRLLPWKSKDLSVSALVSIGTTLKSRL